MTEREQQGSIVTCRCSVVSGSFTAQSVIALFRSTIALETAVGSRLTICSPWRECTMQGDCWLELELPVSVSLLLEAAGAYII